MSSPSFTSYEVLKQIHVTCVALTFLSFSLRYYWMLTGNSLLQSKPARILPHIIDTLLLVSAVGLCLILIQYPLVNHWLTAKVLGLLVYIALGTIALKRGKTKGMRALAGAGAYLCLAYIAGVAVTKSASWILFL